MQPRKILYPINFHGFRTIKQLLSIQTFDNNKVAPFEFHLHSFPSCRQKHKGSPSIEDPGVKQKANI